MIAVMDRDQITAEVAARLVAGQFPQWAGLPVVPVGLNGWDNITFRLGGDLSIRLPSGQDYAAQVAKEHRWLPILAGQLPAPIPEPVALGQPAAGFPWPWSVYRWIEGEPAGVNRITSLTGFAADLARFLGALYAIDASDGPPPGPHSFFRGGPVASDPPVRRTRRRRWRGRRRYLPIERQSGREVGYPAHRRRRSLSHSQRMPPRQ